MVAVVYRVVNKEYEILENLYLINMTELLVKYKEYDVLISFFRYNTCLQNVTPAQATHL